MAVAPTGFRKDTDWEEIHLVNIYILNLARVFIRQDITHRSSYENIRGHRVSIPLSTRVGQLQVRAQSDGTIDAAKPDVEENVEERRESSCPGWPEYCRLRTSV